MVNLVSDAFASNYEIYEERHGAAYYECEGSVWDKNPEYGPLPEIRFFEAKDLLYQKIVQGRDIYGLIHDETLMGWLNVPANSPNPFSL
jgi:glucose-6-phosphate isomerase